MTNDPEAAGGGESDVTDRSEAFLSESLPLRAMAAVSSSGDMGDR